MMIKAIFFDIDGTLVSFKTHKIPESTIQALHTLKAKGIKLFTAIFRNNICKIWAPTNSFAIWQIW